MSLFSRIFSAPEQKVSAGHSVHVLNPGQAVWSARTYEGFSSEGYSQNVVAHQAIEKLARAIAAMRWQVRLPDGTTTDKHPLLDLLRKPNPKEAGPTWWKNYISYLLLDGNAYIEKVERGSRILELWNLRPDRMAIVQAATGLPSAYVYNANGTRKVKFPSDPVSGKSPINHTQLFHPLHDWMGQSPITAAAYAIDQHNEAMRWLQSLLQNSARPSGALVVKSEGGLTDQEYTRLRKDIEDQYAGSRNAGRPFLLEGDMEWKEMGLSPADMEIVSQKDSAARDISLAFGIPPLLLNIPGDNTFANYREARLGFYEDTVIPFLTEVLADFNMWLSPSFGGALLEPDLDAIEAIADKRRDLWKMVDTSYEITVNEARALKGFDPLEGPIGKMLMADLRSTSRMQDVGGSSVPSPDATAKAVLAEIAYGR